MKEINIYAEYEKWWQNQDVEYDSAWLAFEAGAKMMKEKLTAKDSK